MTTLARTPAPRVAGRTVTCGSCPIPVTHSTPEMAHPWAAHHRLLRRRVHARQQGLVRAAPRRPGERRTVKKDRCPFLVAFISVVAIVAVGILSVLWAIVP